MRLKDSDNYEMEREGEESMRLRCSSANQCPLYRERSVMRSEAEH